MSAKPCNIRVVLALAVITAATAPATAQTDWRSASFPAPNGGWLVFRIAAGGNPACASYNGRDCLWGRSSDQIRFDRVRQLTCGADHRDKWGVTGYEDPRHWCNLARAARSTRFD
jgi:hypothetical protein